MSKSNDFETGLLNLVFKNTAYTTVGDAAGLPGSVGAGDLFVSLHTADPGEAGGPTTSETAYTGYLRVAVARGAGWTVTGNSVSPAADIDFAECTGAAGGPITHFGVSTDSIAGGTGKLLYSGTVSPSITLAVGVIPRLKTTSVISED